MYMHIGEAWHEHLAARIDSRRAGRNGRGRHQADGFDHCPTYDDGRVAEWWPSATIDDDGARECGDGLGAQRSGDECDAEREFQQAH